MNTNMNTINESGNEGNDKIPSKIINDKEVSMDNNGHNPFSLDKILVSTNRDIFVANSYDLKVCQFKIQNPDGLRVTNLFYVKGEDDKGILLLDTQSSCYIDDGGSIKKFHLKEDGVETLYLSGKKQGNDLVITVIDEFKYKVLMYTYINGKLESINSLFIGSMKFKQSLNGDIYFIQSYEHVSRILTDGKKETFLRGCNVQLYAEGFPSVEKLNSEAKIKYPDRMYQDPDEEGEIFPDYFVISYGFLIVNEKELIEVRVKVSHPESYNTVCLYLDVADGFKLCAMLHLTEGECVFVKSIEKNGKILPILGIKSLDNKTPEIITEEKNGSGLQFEEPIIINYPHDFEVYKIVKLQYGVEILTSRFYLMDSNRLLQIENGTSVYELLLDEERFSLIYESPKGELITGLFPYTGVSNPQPL